MLANQNTAVLNDRVGFGARGWTVITFQAILFWIASGACTHSLNVVLPALASDYQLDYSTLLALATPASWTSVLGGPLCAWLIEKKGAKFTVIFCLIACGLCFGLLGHFGSYLGFALLFAGVSFFATGYAYVGGTAIIASWFVRKQGIALGWCTMGQTFSSAFFVPILAALFVYFGVEFGFWGISLMMFVMAALVFVFITNRPEDVGMAPDNMPLSAAELAATHKQNDEEPLLSVREMLRMRDVWLMGIATGGIYILLVGTTSQIIPRLIGMGYEQNTAILFMTISALCGLPATYGWGWLSHKVGVKSAIMTYTLWWMVAIILNIFAWNPILLCISMLMIGLSMPGATNLSTQIVASKFPRRAYVRAIGIIHPVQSIVRCFSFSILAVGQAWLGGYTSAYLLLVAVGIITLILLWMIDLTPVSPVALRERKTSK